MKKILNVLVVFLLLTACQTQKEKLGLNLSKGEVYHQKMNSKVSIEQTVNGQPMNINMSYNASMSYKVTDLQEGVYEMEVRYESLVMKMSLPNGEMEFSSEKNDPTDIMSIVLAYMKDKPFLVKMTTTGKVNEVKNIETIFYNVFDQFPQLSDAQKEQIKAQLTQAYGEKAFKGNIEMCSAIFSENAVAKGDEWTIHTDMESGMSAKMKSVYELKEVTDTQYKIFGNSKIETADKDAYIESNGMPLRYDLNGTMTSDITIDKNTCWTTSAIIKQSIKGTAYVKGNPQMPEGTAIPMSINSEINISEK